MIRNFSTKSSRLAFFLILFLAGIWLSFDNRPYANYFEITKNLEIFNNIYKELNTYYVDELEPSRLMRVGVDAMLESLDPYTNFISETDIESFRFMTTGRYGGIGADIRSVRGKVVIMEAYEESPALQAGLKAGDVITHIEGNSTAGRTTEEVQSILRGAAGGVVRIRVERPGTTGYTEYEVERREISVPNVPYSGLVEDNIAYINLSTFTQRAGRNVADALTRLQREHEISGVILDLRGNGGGLLNEAVNVSNVFISKNKLVSSTRGKVQEWDRSFRTLNNPVDTAIPLVVLIDHRSASASEIVSGVMQDYDRGVLVGQQSFGKGLVQNTRDVGYNSRVKLTTAKYYIPSGRCIQSIDYSEGAAMNIPDSLRSAFRTANGRVVYDGGGVRPDIEIPAMLTAPIITALMTENIIFDFCTQYYLNHSEIDDPRTFSINDKVYDEFIQYALSRNFSYETPSEKMLQKLRNQIEEDNYKNLLENEINNLKQRLSKAKDNDFVTYRPEITRLIESELVSRYYLRTGRIKYGLANDEEVKQAVQVLRDQETYRSLLGRG